MRPPMGSQRVGYDLANEQQRKSVSWYVNTLKLISVSISLIFIYSLYYPQTCVHSSFGHYSPLRTCWVNSLLPHCKFGPQEGILIEIEAYT